MSAEVAFIFPGQGSQSVGMLADYYQKFSVFRKTFALGSELLGYDVWKLVQSGSEESLAQTEITQPLMLIAGVAVWRVWNAQDGGLPQCMAGHSLGEYTALVCSGSLAFEDAVPLVQKRARAMAQAVPQGEGAMAAVLGLEDEVVLELCEQASSSTMLVSAVNFNSPGQVVLGGHKPAVDRAIELAKKAGSRRAIMIAMSVPSHCRLMKPAADQLKVDLEKTIIRKPDCPVINNVDVKVEYQPEAIRQALYRQIYHPVYWSGVVKKMAAMGVREIVECGPGRVLTGLVKRIDRQLSAVSLSDVETLSERIQTHLQLSTCG